MFFFALVVIHPVHYVLAPKDDPTNDDPNSNKTTLGWTRPSDGGVLDYTVRPDVSDLTPPSYFWMYVVFTYLFSAYAIYLIFVETTKIIWVRQQYLASQATITDRTIRLSGIPSDLLSEEKIKEVIETLEIGKVDSVVLCRDWKELDDLLDRRDAALRRFEEVNAVLNIRKATAVTQPQALDDDARILEVADDDGEEDGLLVNGSAHGNPNLKRPTVRLWYGRFKLRYKTVDALYYFEEKLRRLDEEIAEARQKEYTPVPFAFITMDSVAACQMAAQAILDPSPEVLLAEPSPAPQDVVWRNTYMTKWHRLTRSWLVSTFIILLTVPWLIPIGAISTLIDAAVIRQISKSLADAVENNDSIRYIVTVGIPTLIVTILNVSVPYLYDWLSNMQGMISQADVDLSVISKNFFFTFFSVFFVFTVFRTTSEMFTLLQRGFHSAPEIMMLIAQSYKRLSKFYANLIILQALGLFPLRLLEFGSVFLYPFGYYGAKTPRDFKELKAAPVFKYGFYLPQSLLILIICIVYSVLPAGYQVLGFGVLYFIIGYFTYKYQLLYAMDHGQHSTGQAWPLICYRVILGLFFFQLMMAIFLGLNGAVTGSILTLALLCSTVWFSYYYARSLEPLTKYIALRGIHQHIRDVNGGHANGSGPDITIPEDTIDELRERQATFVNPNLYAT
jgi:hypothetical protein